jgi:hypothetical protein
MILQSNFNVDIPMAYMTVNKNLNTMFFASVGGNNFANPTAGTVIDRGVTTPG